MRHGAGLVVALAVAACGQPACQPGAGAPMLVAQLLFGRTLPDGSAVTEAAWRDFLAREVTPRFPDGLTVLDGYGQWRDPKTGAVGREPSTMVEIVTPGGAQTIAKLNEVRNAYERAFDQQSVGLVLGQGCADFAPVTSP